MQADINTSHGLTQQSIGLSEHQVNLKEHTSLSQVNHSTQLSNEWQKPSNDLTEIAASVTRMGTDTLSHQVSLVMYHSQFPIRALPEQKAKAQFNAMLLVIITSYFGADKNTPDMVYAECFNRMIKDYGSISIEEVREAHAEAAKGTDRFSAKAFGGIYTANIFTEVMHAWKQKRSKIIAAIKEAESKKPEIEAAQLESKKKEFSKYCNDWLTSQLLNRTVKHWSELSLGVCQELIDSGVVKGSRPDLWKQSAELTVKQFEHERDKAGAEKDFSTFKQMNNVVQSIMDGIVPQDALSKRKGIYARLLVFDCIESNQK